MLRVQYAEEPWVAAVVFPSHQSQCWTAFTRDLDLTPLPFLLPRYYALLYSFLFCLVYALQVLATNGDTHLGGEDFDQRVMQYFMKLFKKKTGADITGDNKAVQKLRREVRPACLLRWGSGQRGGLKVQYDSVHCCCRAKMVTIIIDPGSRAYIRYRMLEPPEAAVYTAPTNKNMCVFFFLAGHAASPSVCDEVRTTVQ